MSRSVVGYIRKYLNASATASPTQSVEATTGLPIQTGINPGVFQEFSDAEAATYASKQVNSVIILTAGSGQTAGTYSVTASAGGATISVVVAAGGTVTAIPTVTNGGVYATDTTPTFTLTGTGGTPATFAVTLGYLYSGVYAFATLDPAVTGGPIAIGTPLYWLQTSSAPVVTTTLSGNFPDFAGWSIDPNFGPLLPNAFIQMNGKGKLLFPTANFPATYGDTVNLVAGGATFTSTAGQATSTPLTVGYALAVGTTLVPALCRVTRYPSRY
jgi:hypothetical protein